jgi:deoxyribodipyrimidine photolyase-related protein
LSSQIIINRVKFQYLYFFLCTNEYKLFYKKIDNIKCIKIADYSLEKKIGKINQLDNINFLIKLDELDSIKQLIYKNNKYSHDAFYKYQRIKLDILLKDNKPIGNKWSFDNDNRLPLPKKHIVKEHITKIKINKYIKEAINYVNKHFPQNYGNPNLIYPIDNKGAKIWLNKFLKERLILFGKYEDASHSDENFLYHSVISPMMNIGILTDIEVVHISYKYYLEHKNIISLESFEGFIRQIIGWRQYVYFVYILEGDKMRKTNLLDHHNKLNDKWWNNIEMPPIDFLIEKINVKIF